MGGRGASSGWSVDRNGNPKNPYGSQYHSSLTAGNVKFVSKNEMDSETLMETMTRGRVYAHVEGDDLKSIVYFDNENKRSKQIDIATPTKESNRIRIMATTITKTIRRKAQQGLRRMSGPWLIG